MFFFLFFLSNSFICFLFMGQVEHLIQERGWEFMWNERLGYVLTCPSNLGTGLRAGVHVRLPNLSKVTRPTQCQHVLLTPSIMSLLWGHLATSVKSNESMFVNQLYLLFLKSAFIPALQDGRVSGKRCVVYKNQLCLPVFWVVSLPCLTLPLYKTAENRSE